MLLTPGVGQQGPGAAGQPLILAAGPAAAAYAVGSVFDVNGRTVCGRFGVMSGIGYPWA
jgi:hypothetical protein